MKTLFRAVSQDRKQFVLLKEDDNEEYTVVAKIVGERREFNYHACYKFDVIRKFIKESVDN